MDRGLEHLQDKWKHEIVGLMSTIRHVSRTYYLPYEACLNAHTHNRALALEDSALLTSNTCSIIGSV